MSRVRSSCRVSASGTPRVRVRSSPLARLLRWLARVARLDMRKPGESCWGYISWLIVSVVLSALLIVGPAGNANTSSFHLRFSRLIINLFRLFQIDLSLDCFVFSPIPSSANLKGEKRSEMIPLYFDIIGYGWYPPSPWITRQWKNSCNIKVNFQVTRRGRKEQCNLAHLEFNYLL